METKYKIIMANLELSAQLFLAKVLNFQTLMQIKLKK